MLRYQHPDLKKDRRPLPEKVTDIARGGRTLGLTVPFNKLCLSAELSVVLTSGGSSTSSKRINMERGSLAKGIGGFWKWSLKSWLE